MCVDVHLVVRERRENVVSVGADDAVMCPHKKCVRTKGGYKF